MSASNGHKSLKVKQKKTEVVPKVMNKPVASKARIASQNVSALSRRRVTSLVGTGDAVNWKILDKRCISCQGHK